MPEPLSAMSSARYAALLTSTFLCALLAAMLLILGLYNRQAQTRLQGTQAEVNALQDEVSRGSLAQRYVQDILVGLSEMSEKKPAVQSLLARYGVTIKPRTGPENP